MKKRKEKKVSLPGKISFLLHNIFLSLILFVSLCASILDNLFGIVSWPDDYSTVISVSSQIITGIVSLVVSIISIAISLQNEEFFGIKITKLYALRAEKHYSILHIILVSIFLCAINLAFYMLGLTIAAIGTLLVALLFLFKVVRAEIPIMAKDEIALLGILKSNIISCYLSKKEASQDLKEAIKYLLWLDRILFGGSISKHTFIEGTSDVDALVILDRAAYKNATPKELQTAFAKMLRKRFPKTEIKCGTLAVTVKFSNYEIQLLPAMKNNGKLQIASSDGSHWSSSISCFLQLHQMMNRDENETEYMCLTQTLCVFA